MPANREIAQKLINKYSAYGPTLEDAITKALDEKDRLNEVEVFKHQSKANYCAHNHAFCPDCRDKLPADTCHRCEWQRREGGLLTQVAALREALEDLIKQFEPFAEKANPQTRALIQSWLEGV